jgi:hypothetical protein
MFTQPTQIHVMSITELLMMMPVSGWIATILLILFIIAVIVVNIFGRFNVHIEANEGKFTTY